MASKIGGRNNCPTSNRDGICVDTDIDKQTQMDLAATNGNVFMPSPEDIVARDLRDREALFVADDTFDLRLELDDTEDSSQRKDLEAEITARNLTLDTMPEPTDKQLAEEERLSA